MDFQIVDLIVQLKPMDSAPGDPQVLQGAAGECQITLICQNTRLPPGCRVGSACQGSVLLNLDRLSPVVKSDVLNQMLILLRTQLTESLQQPAVREALLAEETDSTRG